MKKLITMIALLTLTTACSTTNENQLVVGLECNYAPFNWTQVGASDESVAILGGGGYCDGYDIAIATQIAEELGKELVVKKVSWDGLPVALQSGDIDMIVAGMTETEERAEVIDFSEPYYVSNLVMVVQKDSSFASAISLSDLNGANVVAQKGTFHVNMVSQIPNVNSATPMNSFPEMSVAVVSGAVDGLIAEFPVAQAIVQANPSLTIVTFENGTGFDYDQQEVSVSVAVQKGNDELRTSINSVLSKISSEQRKQLMIAAIARQPEAE